MTARCDKYVQSLTLAFASFRYFESPAFDFTYIAKQANRIFSTKAAIPANHRELVPKYVCLGIYV